MIPCLPETFSSAVSGFCHVFIHSATREKSFFLPTQQLPASACGRHGRFPPHARKNRWYPGYQNDNIFWWEGENLSLNKKREDKIRNWLIHVTLLKTKCITICDFIAYKHRWVFSSDIFEEDMKNSETFVEYIYIGHFWIPSLAGYNAFQVYYSQLAAPNVVNLVKHYLLHVHSTVLCSSLL